MTDVAAARADVGVFAEQVLRRPLWPHQLEAAGSRAFVTSIAAARRTGKTVLVETLAIWVAFRQRGVKVVILSATQDAARRVTEEIGATLAGSRLLRTSVVEDFATRIRLTNGSEIISLPASQRQVRGYGRGVMLLVVDEAGFVGDELWRAAHYIALDERAAGARVLLCGTPWGAPGAFFRQAFEAGGQADPDYASHHWTHEANPLLDHAYLLRMRDRVSPAEYAAEVLGEWSDAAGSLFPRSLLERSTADVELGPLEWLRPPARLLLGTDWGVSFDRSSAVAIGRLPVASLNPDLRPLSRFVVAGVKVWPAGTPMIAGVVGDIVALPAAWARINSEVNGVGAGPTQELLRRLEEREERERLARGPGWGSEEWRLRSVFSTAALKTDAYGRLLWLLEQERLVLPRHPDLLRQLAGLRFEQGARGALSIEAENAHLHDDVADALMLASGPYVVRGRRGVRSTLAGLAARTDWPDAELPADVECVSTGGGLRVPRKPWLQSVDGLEVTGPPGRGGSLSAAIRAALDSEGVAV